MILLLGVAFVVGIIRIVADVVKDIMQRCGVKFEPVPLSESHYDFVSRGMRFRSSQRYYKRSAECPYVYINELINLDTGEVITREVL